MGFVPRPDELIVTSGFKKQTLRGTNKTVFIQNIQSTRKHISILSNNLNKDYHKIQYCCQCVLFLHFDYRFSLFLVSISRL